LTLRISEDAVLYLMCVVCCKKCLHRIKSAALEVLEDSLEESDGPTQGHKFTDSQQAKVRHGTIISKMCIQTAERQIPSTEESRHEPH